MRAFVLMILVFNLGFFAWYYFSGRTQPVVILPAPSAVEQVAPSLVLVSEARSKKPQESGTEVAESSQIEVVAEPLVAAAVTPPTAATPVSTPAPAPIPIQAVEPQPASEQDEVVEVTAPSPSLKVALCYKAGPFEQRTQPVELIKMSEQYGFDAEIAVEKRQRFLGEWIYLIEYDTIKAARADVVALKGQGIKDIAIARLEDGQLIISLGIYGQQATLKRRLDELKALGYVNYLTKKHFRDADQFWLRLAGFEGEQQRAMADELGEILSEHSSSAVLEVVECR